MSSLLRTGKIQRIGAVVFFLQLTAIAGWNMLSHPLWGCWPLLFSLSLWMAGVMFFFPKDADKRKWLGAATLSGVLLGIGFPPSPFTWVVLFAWIPLLAVENGIFQKTDRIKPGQMFLFSWHAFVLWNVIATFWVTNTAFVAGLIANFINAGLMACVMMFIHMVARRLPLKWFPVVFISLWISFEFLHHFWEISWPWLTLGNALAEYPWAVQWYEYTGIFGGSFWVLAVNWLGYSMVTRWLKAKSLRVPLYATVLLVPIGLSLLIGAGVKPSANPPVQVVVVQPNFEPHYEKFDIPQREQVRQFYNLSQNALDSNVRYLVFPETSFDGILLNKFREDETMIRFQDLIDRYEDLHLVMGLSSYRILMPNEKDGPAVRTHKARNGEITYWDIQNSAVEISSGKQAFDVYFKSKFVPGPEIFPFKKYLFFLRPIVDKLGGSYEGHTSQRERSVFDDGPLKVAPVICYESIYGDYTGGYVRNGATALFIITNDGWWDKTPGHIQHLKLGALRAIEHRRPIARSANTGISCFIDIKGKIHQPTAYREATTVRGEIVPETRLTFYTRFGDLIAKACVLGLIVCQGYYLTVRFRSKTVSAKT